MVTGFIDGWMVSGLSIYRLSINGWWIEHGWIWMVTGLMDMDGYWIENGWIDATCMYDWLMVQKRCKRKVIFFTQAERTSSIPIPTETLPGQRNPASIKVAPTNFDSSPGRGRNGVRHLGVHVSREYRKRFYVYFCFWWVMWGHGR